MPPGTLKTSEIRDGVPLSSAPYPVELDEFSDLDALTVRYYTTYDAVKDLVPEEFELDEEPVVSLGLLKYGFSPIGAYTEFVSMVQVKWKGEPRFFPIELILDNEGAIFAGRERWGIPKVFGKVIWDPSATSPVPPGYVTGYAERPAGSKLVQLSFKPQKKIQASGPVDYGLPSVNIRSIPAPNREDPPSLREVIKTSFEISDAEFWVGEGSVSLFNVSEFNPIHKLKVVRYESAVMLRRAHAVLPSVKPIPL